MSLTWQGKLVVVAVVVAIAMVALGSRADRQAELTLASLEPCELAHHYIDWRVEFGKALDGATTIEGRQLSEFVKRSGQYARAAGAATGSADSHVLRALATVASYDADRDNPDVADADPLFEAFFVSCPAEASALAMALGW